MSNENPLNELIKHAQAGLSDAGIDSARTEAELLAAFALGISRNELKQRLIFGSNISDDAATTYQKLIAERATRKPLQHITGKAPFRYLELNVGPGVFIPRPETELVAGAAITWLNQLSQPIKVAVDLCTGSAAIAIAIATECPDTQVYAVELNEPAITWATQNINNNAPNSVRLIKADARQALPQLAAQVDLVISNPPYLAPGEVPPEAEVHAHDPATALYGQGEDGLEIPRAIVVNAAKLLRPGGYLVMEHGDYQAQKLTAIMQQHGFDHVTSHQDLAGRDRFITAIRS